MQAAAEAGSRAPDWPGQVEGTYLRMDIPGIVPHLLQQLDQHRPGLGDRINHELVLYTGMTFTTVLTPTELVAGACIYACAGLCIAGSIIVIGSQA